MAELASWSKKVKKAVLSALVTKVMGVPCGARSVRPAAGPSTRTIEAVRSVSTNSGFKADSVVNSSTQR